MLDNLKGIKYGKICRKWLERLDFNDVRTYFNTGNVVFSSIEEDVDVLTKKIEDVLKKNSGLDIPVCVVSIKTLNEALIAAPNWWGKSNKDIYNNLIFMIPPFTLSTVYKELGMPNFELENIENFKNMIFWSFDHEKYQKTNWWSRTNNSDIAHKLTIRSANTVRKICKM
ncbi:DUF1697 domain-containing protein [Streptococcus gallolyticus]|nr:DUF1697 domain-containing protein [Streptococcus gallolyticus]MBY5041361.1 DUF1697 domain-containing protein [Streptococcus gallolyticus]